MRKLFVLVVGASLCAISYAQTPADAQSSQQSDAQTTDSAQQQPSLGDYARQVRLKKQQRDAQLQQAKAKPVAAAQASDATPEPQTKAHVVTNDETPERATVTTASVRQTTPADSDSQPSTSDHEAQGANWKSEILAQKQAIAALEQDIKSLGDSIHFAGGNCVANCAQWNEHQQQKQQEVETMKAQLEEQQKVLEEMQDKARKAGFGSTITDP
jgi:hypothetical protein